MTICHSCCDRELAEAEIDVCQRLLTRALGGPLSGSEHALDVGCGTSGAGRRILDPGRLRTCDTSPHISAYYGDLDEAPDDYFTAVLVKRVLCQHPTLEQPFLLAKAWEKVRPGGALVLCEPYAPARDACSKLREAWGLSKLQWPRSGGYCVTDTTLATLPQVRASDIVAPQYTAWTRLVYPVMARAGAGLECPYDVELLRVPLVAIPEKLANKVAFYRAWAWKK